MQGVQLEMQDKQADIAKKMAEAEQIKVETQLKPSEVQAKVVAALSNNLNEDAEGADFERRARIAELMLKEADIQSNHDIAKMQMAQKREESQRDSEYVSAASE